MKKFLLFCFIVPLSIVTCGATTFGYNGIVFNTLDDSTCEVGVNISLPDEVVIPDKAYDGSGNEYSVVGIGDEAFYSCYYTSSVEIPNTVTYIGYRAFYGSALNEIDIPSSVKSIGEAAFRQSGVKKITLHEGLVSIGDQAFMSCRGVVDELTIPSTVEKLGTSICRGMENIKKITILANLTEIPSRCFHTCSSLESINIPETVESIELQAFWSCRALKELTLPEGLKSIGGGDTEGAFGGCAGLETMTIPENVTLLDENSFYNCSGLEEVIMGDYIKDINKTVFKNCTSLKYVTMGNAVENIYVYAFQNCTSLEEITIPESVEFIEHAAFLDCSSLAKVYSLNPTPPEVQEADIENGAFTGIAEECVLYVPEGCKEKYESAYGWKDFFDIVELTEPEPEGISSIHVDSENVEGIYSTSGQKLDSTVDGVNIVRYTDGTTKKILVK